MNFDKGYCFIYNMESDSEIQVHSLGGKFTHMCETYCTSVCSIYFNFRVTYDRRKFCCEVDYQTSPLACYLQNLVLKISRIVNKFMRF